MKNILYLIIGFILLIPDSAYSQADTVVQFVDATDLGNVLSKKKSTKKQKSGVPEKGKLILFVVPVIGSNPSLGAFYGVGGTGAMYLGSPENTSISSLGSSLLITTKNQFVASIKGTVMTPENGWEMLVDLKYSFFSESTFGLGSDYNQPIQESWSWGGVETAGIGGAQPMTFNQVRTHITALKAVSNNVYTGIGYHLDYHYGIKDLTLDLEAPNPVITSHYAYSVQEGFEPGFYTTSGLSFNLVFDSRDHTVSPYNGSFLQFTYRNNPTFLGSTKDSHQLYLESRLYKSLSKTRLRHLIGLWGIAQIQTKGSLPYLDLPASSYDMRNRIGRGYVAGRFRGPAWVTLETEYRFPITANGLLGGVLFASGTTTSRDAIDNPSLGIDEPKLSLFKAIRPAAGFGARVMLNRSGRLNLTMDMAFGQNGSKGFYFAVGETF
ncbi:MAG: BamA/TamA family outer membrane protein [Cyclobacteriaceae bacterium]|nr:BamA/TamA family outer membrane protein [Cyclobacteriaceae bacterium]